MSHKFSYRVYYEDTDAGGIVYYANYLKFFERARTDLLRELGISQSELAQKENLGFVVRKCEIEYFAPARLDDILEVSAEVKEMTATSIVMLQEAKKSGLLLATLEVRVVCIDRSSFKPAKIPDTIKALFEKSTHS